MLPSLHAENHPNPASPGLLKSYETGAKNSTMINLIFSCLLCINLVCSNGTPIDKEITIPRLSESKQMPITEIISDIMTDSANVSESEEALYVCSLSRLGRNIRIDIHKESGGTLNKELNPLGYLLLGESPVIIISDDSFIDDGLIKIPTNSKSIKIKVESRHPGVIYDPDSWTYLVSDGNFARYVYGIGWVWNIRNKNSNKKKLGKFIIENPKRNGNNK